MVFASNQWYVAAFDHEIGRTPFVRTVCGENILFWRTEAGEVTAMSHRCVHRSFPLGESPSHLVGDAIVCGYHGFTYGADGVCVSVPGQTRVPRTARLKSFPVAEVDTLIWVWIGDPENADATTITRAPWLDDPAWTVVRGMEPLAARHSLLMDNLMDLSHETYLHAGYIGTPEVAETPITTQVDEEAGVVYVSRHMDDAECPPFFSESTGMSGRIVRWQDIEFHPPCLYLLHIRVAPHGCYPAEDGADPDAFRVEVVYAMTPETENSTHDFWMVARDYALEDEAVSAFLHDSNRAVVRQDVVALDEVEKVVAAAPADMQELSINIDTGGLAARRLMAALVDGDRVGAAAAAPPG